MGEEVEIRGYIDPRTGEYKRATEANHGQVVEDLGFIMAWAYYWDGPLGLDKRPIFDRKTWRQSDARKLWLADLTEKQRQTLADCPPPEEFVSLDA